MNLVQGTAGEKKHKSLCSSFTGELLDLITEPGTI